MKTASTEKLCFTQRNLKTAERTPETLALIAELARFRIEMDRHGFLRLDADCIAREPYVIWREAPGVIIAARTEPYTGEEEPDFNETIIYDIYLPALSLKAVKCDAMTLVPDSVMSSVSYGLPSYMNCVASADPYALCAVEYVAGYSQMQDVLNAQILELCLRFSAPYALRSGDFFIEQNAKAGGFETINAKGRSITGCASDSSVSVTHEQILKTSQRYELN